MLHTMVLAAILAGASLAWAQEPPPAPAKTPVADVITLEAALSRARARSPLVDAARERQRGAEIAQSMVTRAPNPFVELRGENFGPSAERLPRDVFATVSQPIELGGKRAARHSIATSSSALATAEVSAAEWLLTLDVVDAYLAAVQARDVRAILVEQQQSVAEIVLLLQQRVREGLSAEADQRKFETEHTRLASSIARTAVGLESALIRLGTMVGEPLTPGQVSAPVVPPPAHAEVVTDPDVQGRADVLAARRRLERAESLLALERARGVPDVTVTAGYKRTGGSDTGVAAVTFPIAFFDRNRPAVAQATGEVAAARADLRAVTQWAVTDARSRLMAARRLAEQAARSDADLVRPASIVRNAARAAFAEGRGDVLQLVDAERVYGEAMREALELRLDALHATIQARIAFGETPLQ